jgi:hypothetical protein
MDSDYDYCISVPVALQCKEIGANYPSLVSITILYFFSGQLFVPSQGQLYKESLKISE